MDRKNILDLKVHVLKKWRGTISQIYAGSTPF